IFPAKIGFLVESFHPLSEGRRKNVLKIQKIEKSFQFLVRSGWKKEYRKRSRPIPPVISFNHKNALRNRSCKSLSTKRCSLIVEGLSPFIWRTIQPHNIASYSPDPSFIMDNWIPLQNSSHAR